MAETPGPSPDPILNQLEPFWKFSVALNSEPFRVFTQLYVEDVDDDCFLHDGVCGAADPDKVWHQHGKFAVRRAGRSILHILIERGSRCLLQIRSLLEEAKKQGRIEQILRDYCVYTWSLSPGRLSAEQGVWKRFDTALTLALRLRRVNEPEIEDCLLEYGAGLDQAAVYVQDGHITFLHPLYYYDPGFSEFAPWNFLAVSQKCLYWPYHLRLHAGRALAALPERDWLFQAWREHVRLEGVWHRVTTLLEAVTDQQYADIAKYFAHLGTQFDPRSIAVTPLTAAILVPWPHILSEILDIVPSLTPPLPVGMETLPLFLATMPKLLARKMIRKGLCLNFHHQKFAGERWRREINMVPFACLFRSDILALVLRCGAEVESFFAGQTDGSGDFLSSAIPRIIDHKPENPFTEQFLNDGLMGSVEYKRSVLQSLVQFTGQISNKLHLTQLVGLAVLGLKDWLEEVVSAPRSLRHCARRAVRAQLTAAQLADEATLRGVLEPHLGSIGCDHLMYTGGFSCPLPSF